MSSRQAAASLALRDMLPTLTLVTTTEADVTPPPLPLADRGEGTAWRDPRGRLGAVSHWADGRPWLHVMDVASFRLDLTEDRVIAVARPGTSLAAVEDEFHRTVWPVVLQLKGWEILHASAVRTADGVAAFCAPSETGKSTLAYALSRRGYPLWSDDALVLDITSERVMTLPLPFRVRLRSASRDHFRRDAGSRHGRTQSARPPAPLPLTSIVLLVRNDEPNGGPAMSVEHLGGARSVPVLLAHAIHFGFEDVDRKRRMIEHYLLLAGGVPIHRVAFKTGFERLDDVLDALRDELKLEKPK